MPKIIDNLSEKLIREAHRQVMESGYAALNIRSVAKNCGVGVGTVYNYFPSKEALVAAFLVEDWMGRLNTIRHTAGSSDCIDPALEAIYQVLREFYQDYSTLFRDFALSSPAPSPRYHEILRSQLSDILRPFCPDDFTSLFVSEAMLVWSVAGIPLAQISGIIHKIL